MNKLVIIILGLAPLLGSEVISNVPCDGKYDRDIISKVHEIRIVPCPEANVGKPCQWRKGTFPRIEVDFTPRLADGTFRRVKAGLYRVSKLVDLPFRGMETNACKSMTCPTRGGKRWSYNTTLWLGRNLPIGSYPMKFKLYDGRRRIVCQLLQIKLIEADQ